MVAPVGSGLPGLTDGDSFGLAAAWGAFEVFKGQDASTGTLHMLAPFQVDGPDAHRDGVVYMKSFSIQLPKGMAKDDFGAKHGFRFKADV